MKCFCHCDWSIEEQRDTLFQIAYCCVTGLWPQFHRLVWPFKNWLIFMIWLIKHRDIHLMDILLMWEQKTGCYLAYDPWDVTQLWYWIETSGIGISFWNLFRAFLYIWIKDLSNLCSSYVKLCFVRRGQTSLLFSVLCPKPLLRRRRKRREHVGLLRT